jgi:hypothetical protein
MLCYFINIVNIHGLIIFRCDADPAALAKYVFALVRKDKPNGELRSSMVEQLEVFLQKGKYNGMQRNVSVACNIHIASHHTYLYKSAFTCMHFKPTFWLSKPKNPMLFCFNNP